MSSDATLAYRQARDLLLSLQGDPDRARAQRAMDAMMRMVKLDVAELERAADGVAV